VASSLPSRCGRMNKAKVGAGQEAASENHKMKGAEWRSLDDGAFLAVASCKKGAAAAVAIDC